MSYIALESGSVSSWVQPLRDGSLKNNSRFATKIKDEQKKAPSKQTFETTSTSPTTIPSSSSLNGTEQQNTKTNHGGMAEAKENSQLSSMRANVQAINARDKKGHSCRIVRQCPNCQILYTSSFHSCGPSASLALSIRK